MFNKTGLLFGWYGFIWQTFIVPHHMLQFFTCLRDFCLFKKCYSVLVLIETGLSSESSVMVLFLINSYKFINSPLDDGVDILYLISFMQLLFFHIYLWWSWWRQIVEIDRQIARQIDRQIDRQTDREIDRQIDRQIDQQIMLQIIT